MIPSPTEVPAATPVSLLTQEIRFAVTLTGGVSLAVWMGGVARELDVLMHASDDRVAGRSSSHDPVQEGYRRLLDILDTTACVDVISGTSAGGINAALLGLVNAQRKDLGPLGDVWLKAGSLSTLLRDPTEAAPPSLLQGDGQLLSHLQTGIHAILGHAPGSENPHTTDVFITTTLLSPELSRFTDDYGTCIDDADHHGLFHFATQDLNRKDIVAALALAARSSASFPGAFEPAFLPCRPGHADAAHPDMSPYSTITAPHWAADGGLLINRPIDPILDTIFDRAADREVRRALLYVVPTSSPPHASAPDDQSQPLGLAHSLLKDAAATQDQSIAADLSAIRDHNDKVSARIDMRLQLATLGAKLAEGSLCDPSTWDTYRLRQGETLAAPVATEIIKRLRAEPGLRPEWSALAAGGNGLHRTLLTAAIGVITKDWPSRTTRAKRCTPAARAASVGRPAFNAAKAIVLDLLRAGFTLARNENERDELAKAVSAVHGPREEMGAPDLTATVRRVLADPDQPTISAAAETIARTVTGTGDEALLHEFATSWKALVSAIGETAPTLHKLAKATPFVPQAPCGSWTLIRSDARHLICTYLDYLGAGPKGTLDDPDHTLERLLDLIVAARALTQAGHHVDQRVELIQISADTRTELTPGRRQTAASKLTGLQLHHFGAFYKASWRANDWMWGRLDGAGWVTHILLDPRRILAICASQDAAPGDHAERFLAVLENAFGPLGDDPASGASRPELLKDLAFLNDAEAPVPGSLPRLSMAVAAAIQLPIAKQELRCIAAQIQNGEDPINAAQRRWLADYAAGGESDAHIPRLLEECPVADETFAEERDRATPLFLRTATKAAAVTTSALTGLRKPPASLAPVFTMARTITRTAAVATDRTHGNRRLCLLAGVLLMVLGVAALVSHSLLLGVPGLAALGTGMLIVAVAVWRSVPRIVGAVLALALVVLAAAPWLPWLNDHLLSWLERSAVPFLFREKWAWPIVFLLLLLPAVTSVIRLAVLRKPRRRAARGGASGNPRQPTRIAPSP